MSETMIPQKQTVKELVDGLNAHLAELGYRPSSLKTYGGILSKLLDYCEDRNTEVFTIELGRRFVWECYGIILGDRDAAKTVNRAIHMAADFQRYGMIFKQHNVRLSGFSDEYKPLFESFLESLKKIGIAESSLRKYRNFLFRLEHFLKNRGVVYFKQLELHHVNTYVESLAGLSRNTVSAAIGNLRRLFDFARDNGYHQTSFSTVLPTVRYSQTSRLPTSFTAEEVERILENLDRSSPITKRDYAIILIVAKLGLRVSDALLLRFSSINWQSKVISIKQQKTGIPLDLPLPEDVGWAIIDYLKYGRPETNSERLFVRHRAPYDEMTSNFKKTIQRAIQKAGIKVPPNKVFGMHTFRHSIATTILDNGATLPEIAQILGHTNSESTETYIRLSVDMLRQCALEVTVIMEKSYFSGPFAPMCELLVAQKRALGFVYESQSKRLRQFDNFCKKYDIQNYEITEALVTEYCVRHLNESDSARRDRVSMMRLFAEFLVKQGHSSYVLPELPKGGSPHTPYIFTKDEIRRLFERLDALEPTNFSTGHLMFPLLFRVLYGCGLRIFEALSLLKCDVDIEKGILHIRCGKNKRERIAPMSDSLLEECGRFVAEAHAETPDDMPFFYTKTRTVYSQNAIKRQFRGFLWDIGIPYRGKDTGPRIHDIRHTFVCHNIQHWAENGVPIYSKLPILSKYVGHTSVNATQWYLRLTAEVYPHIREICERELSGIYAAILNFKEEGDCDE